MNKILQFIKEFSQIYLEGSFAGLIRYIQFRKLRVVKYSPDEKQESSKNGIGLIGAGTYMVSIHVPCLRLLGESIRSITTSNLDNAAKLAKVNGIEVIHQNIEAAADDAKCTSLLVATPHFLHPEHILLALQSGKYSYCEKPVAINHEGIDILKKSALSHENASKIMVGFNRRFAPGIRQLKKVDWLANRTGPLELHYRINFGERVDNSMSNSLVGGGRIHGAACHYVDLIEYIAGSKIKQVSALSPIINNEADDNTFTACLQLGDGSLASLVFTSEGSRKYDTKEEIFISCQGHTARLVDFFELRVDKKKYKYLRHRYGALATMEKFLAARNNNRPVPISLSDGIDATNATLAIQESINSIGKIVQLK